MHLRRSKLHYGGDSFQWKLEVIWKDGSKDRFVAATARNVVEDAYSRLHFKKLEGKD